MTVPPIPADANVPPRLVPLLNAIASTVGANSDVGYMALHERYRIATALLNGPLAFVTAIPPPILELLLTTLTENTPIDNPEPPQPGR